MAELDEIVQKIMLDGDSAVVSKLKEVGEQGYEAFQQLNEAAEKGLGGLQQLAIGAGLASAAIGGLAVTLTSWVEVNTEAIQKTNFLADAFGATTGQIAGIEAAFAQAGVSAQQFEQFAQRLTVTIAREWPAITESVRDSADEQDAANERVRASIIRVQEAQQNLQVVEEESASRVANAILREEEALVKLQFAAQETFATMVHDLNDVAGANLSLEAAEQRLATLQGRPPSVADKQALELKQAELEVDKARQSEADALRKQQQDAAEAQLKQQKIEQEAADAALKHETALNDAAVARQKAELAVQTAITQRAEAEERATQVALKSIPQITNALKSLEDGQKDVAKSFDLGQVSVRNMVNSIINLASAGSGVKPTGLQVMNELIKLLKSDTDKLIDSDQRLAIVQQLSQRGFNSTGQAAFELLNALERGPTLFNELGVASEKAFANSAQGKKNVEEFRDALVKLQFTIDLINRNFAASAAPVFAAALDAVRESLTSSDGLLHKFVDGIAAIGTAVGSVVGALKNLFEQIDQTFNFEKGRTMQIAIVALTAFVGAFASAWLGIPAIIAAVITVLGVVADHMAEIKKFAEDHRLLFIALGAAIGALVAFFAPIPTAIGLISAAVLLLVANWEKVKAAVSGVIDKVKEFFGIGGAGKSVATEGNSSLPSPQAQVVGAATGGYIRGPGTATSDSIAARLSDGEFVMRAAAVKNFGVDFFHALNNMMVPGFASGGLVGAPARLGNGSGQASRPLNLTIDGHTFNGLRGPKSVVDSLASYAISRQTSSAGEKPSWVK